MRISAQKVYSYKKGNPFVISLVPDQARFVLDIGCGAGDNAEILAGMGHVVDGITISEDESEAARKILRNIYVHNVENGLPSTIQNTYDVVILSHVLEHICYPQNLLKDVIRVLNSGGVLIVALPNLLHFRSRWKLLRGNFNYEEYGIWDYTHFRWYTYRTGKELLEENGFVVEHRDVSGEIPFEPKLRRLLPGVIRRSLFRVLKRISPGLFGSQLLYLARVKGSQTSI